ncbi:MAG TPA: dihydroorotate dehydrogenase-like protein [Polyangiaceae bacterium]|nr:dihydroorotate dehydrogenase-like protein [Polyangiaceae bacterium]
MDLRTTYLGFELPHPIVLGASPLIENLDAVRRAEEAGASAIVMRSLFEEQISMQRVTRGDFASLDDQAREQAAYFLPAAREFMLAPEDYVEHLRRLKSAVSIPVFASLNAVTPDGWVKYAALLDQAGADGLELNLYTVANDPSESSEALERRLLDVVRSVRATTRLPLAVKLTPFFTCLAHFARSLENCGADGLVLFNRFYQQDIELEPLGVTTRLELSTSSELRLRLRWLAALSPLLRTSLAVSGGVHGPEDVVKSVLAGAHCVQVVSEVIRHGVGVFSTLREGLSRWMDEHGYERLSQLRGALNLAHCDNATAYERAGYMHVLNAWRPLPLDHARGVW